MKKILFILVCLFIITGCDVEYNLDIDKNFEEKVMATENNIDNYYYEVGNESLIGLKEIYLHKEIPYYYNDMLVPEQNVRLDGVSYYKVSDLSNDDQIGISLSSKFEDYYEYSKSNVLWKGCSRKSIQKKNGKIYINASNFIIFDEYKVLDNLKVNIKSNYKVLNNNADSVNGDVYSWNIDRNNYKNKEIALILETDINYLEDNFISLIVISSIVLIVSIFIWKNVRRKFSQENSI